MKLSYKLFLLVLFSIVLTSETYPMSNYQIFKICKRERKEKACIKKLKLKRELIYEGKPIEIPVYPYKSK